jgi:acid phosphatase
MEIMMENEAYGDVIGNAAAPNINQLTRTYALATHSYAIGHPSLPNYLEMIAGSNHGVSNDGTPRSEKIASTAPTLANQFETAGISWRAYFESMPSAGYTGGDTGGVDPYGGEYYLQHHNPFVYFPATTSLADFDQNVVPLSSASSVQSDLNAPSAPDFVWVTPNAVDNMHDGPMMADTSSVPTVGDAWLANFIAHVQSTSWYGAGGQIIVEWDESFDSDTSGVGTAGEGGGGHILTLVISANLAASPSQYSTPFNTAGILHSVEATYGLPFLSNAGNASNGTINALMGLASTPAVASLSPSSGSIAGERRSP